MADGPSLCGYATLGINIVPLKKPAIIKPVAFNPRIPSTKSWIRMREQVPPSMV